MIIGVIKPPGLTSHDVIDKLRRITGEKRIGHGGSLDPFAEGVLVVGITRESTKKLGEILKNTDKEYLATLELGKTSTTGDPEGEIRETSAKEIIENITSEEIKRALGTFIGETEQTPPDYSAIKIAGTPAYKLARRGEKVNMKKRVVEVKEIELIKFNPPYLEIRAVVSSGTYIRTLAEDIGKKLNVGAYTKRLIRTRVGDFDLKNSKKIEELERESQNLHTPTPSGSREG